MLRRFHRGVRPHLRVDDAVPVQHDLELRAVA